jgi:hypothetical protein
MPLILEGSITDFVESVEEYGSCQRVPRFSLVETSRDPSSQHWILSHASMKRLLSILPISHSARARLFWRG